MAAPASLVDQSDLIAGYKRASSIAPVKAADLATTFKEYGVDPSSIKKGMSDSLLQQNAAKSVVDWYNKNKAAASTPPATTGAGGAAGGSGSSTGGSSGTGTGGTTSTSTSGTKPAAPKPPAAPVFGPTQISAMLKKAGLAGLKPPLSATKSAAALALWIDQQLKLKARAQLAANDAKQAPAPTTTTTAPIAPHYAGVASGAI